MIRVSKTITINGVEVTMLFTPRLFVMAEEKGIKIAVNTADMWQTLAAYADLCYCAALNHWTMDNDIEDFQLKREDFHVWSAANHVEFGKIMVMASEAITGKTMKELIEENKKSAEGGEDVKKKVEIQSDYKVIEAFLVGHCGMTEREAAMTSIREFQLRLNGYKEHQQVEWDRARWTAFSIFSPFVKNGPKTPKAWVRFPWEQPEVVKVVRIGTIQENRLDDLYMDFMSTKNKIKS